MRSLLYALTVLSLPMRGAWIEIDVYNYDRVVLPESLPMRGAWIEIVGKFVIAPKLSGRSPCGERGLKFLLIFPH